MLHSLRCLPLMITIDPTLSELETTSSDSRSAQPEYCKHVATLRPGQHSIDFRAPSEAGNACT